MQRGKDAEEKKEATSVEWLNPEPQLEQAEKQDAHSNWVMSVAFSPDGKTNVSGSRDQTLKVWDAGAWH